MTYKLVIHEDAEREWRKLDNSIRLQLKKKLAERLVHPRVEADKIREQPDRYKIKLKSVGCRLVYEVQDEQVVVMVIAVGRREDNEVYTTAAKRGY